MPSRNAVRVGAGELPGIGGAVGRRSVEIAADRDRGHIDDGSLEESLLECVVLALAVGEAQPPAVVVDDDVDVVGVVERRRAALVGRVVELPLRRRELPDQLVELTPVLGVAAPAALGGEVVLVPPAELGLRRQGLLVRLEVDDDVAADRDQPLQALRPQRGEGDRRPGSPVETGDDRPVDLDCVQQCEGVDRQGRLLAVPEGLVREESGRSVPAQVRDDHAVALRREQWRHLGIAVDVVGPAVQEENGRPVRRTGFDVADVEQTGLDLAQRTEQLLRAWCRGSRHRNDVNAARISSLKSCGSSHAAKWPPLSTSLK
jgi:hypothetical protein